MVLVFDGESLHTAITAIIYRRHTRGNPLLLHGSHSAWPASESAVLRGARIFHGMTTLAFGGVQTGVSARTESRQVAEATWYSRRLKAFNEDEWHPMRVTGTAECAMSDIRRAGNPILPEDGHWHPHTCRSLPCGGC